MPRVRVTGLPLGSGAERIRELLGRKPHTRYPVIEQDLDHIVGMIDIKDLLRLLLRNEPIGHTARAGLRRCLSFPAAGRFQIFSVWTDADPLSAPPTSTAALLRRGLRIYIEKACRRHLCWTRLDPATVLLATAARHLRVPERSPRPARPGVRHRPRSSARGCLQRQRPGPDAARTPATDWRSTTGRPAPPDVTAVKGRGVEECSGVSGAPAEVASSFTWTNGNRILRD